MARRPRFDPKRSAAQRNKPRFAGEKRITGIEEAASQDSRFTSDEGRPTGPPARGAESRGVGAVPLTGVESTRVSQGTGGMGRGSQRTITGDDEGSQTIYSRSAQPSAKAQQVLETAAQQTQGTMNPLGQYLMGKPTQAELASQFNIALDPTSAASIALRLLPATAAVGTVLGIGSVGLGTGSTEDRAMDLLGMGAGSLYGMHTGRGALMPGDMSPRARALRATTGMLAGKLGSDALQAILGVNTGGMV